MKSAKYIKSILILWFMIAELTEHSPIIIQNSTVVTHQAKKIWMYDCTTIHTYNLCPVVQWSVHWAPSRTTWVLVLAGARRFALEMCGKKNASSAFRLG